MKDLRNGIRLFKALQELTENAPDTIWNVDIRSDDIRAMADYNHKFAAWLIKNKFTAHPVNSLGFTEFARGKVTIVLT